MFKVYLKGIFDVLSLKHWCPLPSLVITLLFLNQKQTSYINHHAQLRHVLANICICHTMYVNESLNTMRPRQNGRHFADDTFNRIFLNENVRISIKFSLKFVPKGPINKIPALFQIMAWRRPGDKPLSGPMMVRLPTHICVTRPQWVKEWTHWGLVTHICVSDLCRPWFT